MSTEPQPSPEQNPAGTPAAGRRDAAPANGIRHKGPLELRRKAAKVTMSDQTLLDTKGPGQFVHTDPWRVLRIQSEFVEGFGALADLGPAVSVFGSASSTSWGWKWDASWPKPASPSLPAAAQDPWRRPTRAPSRATVSRWAWA